MSETVSWALMGRKILSSVTETLSVVLADPTRANDGGWRGPYRRAGVPSRGEGANMFSRPHPDHP